MIFVKVYSYGAWLSQLENPGRVQTKRRENHENETDRVCFQSAVSTEEEVVQEVYSPSSPRTTARQNTTSAAYSSFLPSLSYQIQASVLILPYHLTDKG